MLIASVLKGRVYTSMIRLYIVSIQHSNLHIIGTQQKILQQMYNLRQQAVGPDSEKRKSLEEKEAQKKILQNTNNGSL